MDRRPEGPERKAGKIVVVGICGSGKTLLVESLRGLGYNAASVSQEHSLVPDLFRRSGPDTVIYLEASDETVSGRKQTGWEPRQLAEQRDRLQLAGESADIRINTDGLEPRELLEKVMDELASLL